ncbi:MAG: RidA family protein [Pseudomonadota bacterium]
MKKIIAPTGMPPPASHYDHGVLVPAPRETLYLAGQLGTRPDGTISGTFEEQAQQAWRNVLLLLDEAQMSVGDIVKVTSFLVHREHVEAYVACHKDAVGDHKPPWTLLIVAGLGSPDYLVELDVTAVRLPE